MLPADLQTSLKFFISVHRCTCMTNMCSSVLTLLYIFSGAATMRSAATTVHPSIPQQAA